MSLSSPLARPEALSGNPVLRLAGVKGPWAKRALDDITLTVPENASVSLLGANGSGRTVLRRTVAGFEPLVVTFAK